MTHLNETIYGTGIAASYQGYPTKSGAYLPDDVLANVCKHHVTRFPQGVFPRKRSRRVARIHGAVAVGILRVGFHAAVCGVRFTDDDGRIFELWKRSHNLKTRRNVPQLCSHVHLYVPVHEFRRAFGMKRHEIRRHADFTRHIIGVLGTVFQKVFRKLPTLLPAGPVTCGLPILAVGKARRTASAE